MSGEIDSHITEKYEIKKRLGKGAYGIVWKAVDRKGSEVIALKKIFDAFRNQTDAQRTFREIMFLQEFGSHPNVIKLLNVVKANNDKDIYLVFEFMDTDLHNVIKRGNILKDIHKRYIMYQLFKATKYLHSGNVIHRDYKPSNILLNAECFVKVADFGLARSLTQLEDSEDKFNPDGGFLTEYVATRWYRAPEILLASHKYTKAVDMWSLGCILGEMLLEKPLFPGSSTLNQIEKILADIPTPNSEDINSIKSPYGASVLHKTNVRQKRSFTDIVPSASADAIDLLNHLLHFNPDKRLTADLSLQHSYVSKFHNSSDEPVLNYDVVPPLDDDVQLSIDEYRQKLYEMIIQKKTEIRRNKRNEANKKGDENNNPNKGDNDANSDTANERTEDKHDLRGGDSSGHKNSGNTNAKSNSKNGVSSASGNQASKYPSGNASGSNEQSMASSSNIVNSRMSNGGGSGGKMNASGSISSMSPWTVSSAHLDPNNNKPHSSSGNSIQSQLEAQRTGMNNGNARPNYSSLLANGSASQSGNVSESFAKYDSYGGNTRPKRDRDVSNDVIQRRGTSAPVTRGRSTFTSGVGNPVIMRGDSRSSAVAMNSYNPGIGSSSGSKMMNHHVKSPTDMGYGSSQSKISPVYGGGRRQYSSKNQSSSSFQSAPRTNFGSFTQSHGTITSSGLEQLRNNLKM